MSDAGTSTNRPEAPNVWTFLELLEHHSTLLRKQNEREQRGRPTIKEIAEFITSASQSGRIIGDREARETSQGMLDYWLGTLMSQEPRYAAEGVRHIRLQPFDDIARAAAISAAEKGNGLWVGLPEKEKEMLRGVLNRMIRLRDSTPYTAAFSVQDIPITQAENAILQKFTGAGLLIKRTQSKDDVAYAVAHEELLKLWQPLKDIASQRKAFREFSDAWTRAGEKTEALLDKGPQLDQAEMYTDLNPRELKFKRASLDNHKDRIRRTWERASAGAILGVLGVFLLITSVANKRALQELKRGQSVRASEIAVRLIGDKYPPQSFALAQRVALSSLPSKKELAPPYSLVVLRFASQNRAGDYWDPVPGPEFPPPPVRRPITDMRFKFDLWQRVATELKIIGNYLPSVLSPDKQWLVTLETTANGNPTPIVWNAGKLNQREYELPPCDGDLAALAFDSDGKLLGEYSSGEAVAVWDRTKRTMERRPFRPLNRIIPDTNKIRRTPEGRFYAYSKVRDIWILESLTTLQPVEISELDALPTAVELLDPKAILDAFSLAERNAPEAERQLRLALEDKVEFGDSAAARLIFSRWIYLGNEAAERLDPAAKKLYDMADELARTRGLSLSSSGLLKQLNDKRNFLAEFNSGVVATQKAPSDENLGEAVGPFSKAKQMNERLWQESVQKWDAGRLMDTKSGFIT